MAEKILIVDDTSSNTSILQPILETCDYTVCAAPDGPVALNVVSPMQPDLIILDVWMPQLNGLETCRRLKANPATAEIPIFFANDQLERDIAHRQYTKEMLASSNGRTPSAADQEALAEHFLRLFAGEAGIRTPRQAASAVKLLMSRVFSTSVRELKTQMKQTIGDLATDTKPPKQAAQSHDTPMTDTVTVRSQAEHQMNGLSMDQCPLNLERAESLLIQRALMQTGGNVAKAARLLGINRTRIYRRFRHPGTIASGDAQT